jgi:dolichol kinase
VAAVGPRLRLGPRGQQVLAWALVLTAWGNVIASLIGPLFGGRGLTFGGGVASSIVFLRFMAAVLTVLVATGLVFVGALRTAPGTREEV